MTAFTHEEMTHCANPDCGHRGIMHHPRAKLCLVSDDGEFCGCEEFEMPVENPIDRELHKVAVVTMSTWGPASDLAAARRRFIDEVTLPTEAPHQGWEEPGNTYMGMTEEAFAELEAAEPAGKWECPLCGDIGAGSPSEHICPTPIVHRRIDEAAARRVPPEVVQAARDAFRPSLSDKARLALAKARRVTAFDQARRA